MTLDTLLELARLALDLGRVERATRHQDGVRQETDADHTLMLAFIAWHVAKRINDIRPGDWHEESKPVVRLVVAPYLDLGKVLRYALIHDAHEAVEGVGDTQTFRISDDELEKKRQREQAGIKKLSEALPTSFSFAIIEYHVGSCPEARLVYYLDKLVPKLTHALNDGAALRAMDATAAEVKARHEAQKNKLSAYAEEFPEVAALMDAAMEASYAAMQKPSPKEALLALVPAIMASGGISGSTRAWHSVYDEADDEGVHRTFTVHWCGPYGMSGVSRAEPSRGYDVPIVARGWSRDLPPPTEEILRVYALVAEAWDRNARDLQARGGR